MVSSAYNSAKKDDSKYTPYTSMSLKPYSTLKALNSPQFCPIKDSPHEEGQRMPFSFIVKALTLIEDSTGKNSRTIVTEIITNIFRAALLKCPEEIADIFYFFIVKLAPDYEAVETGIGHEQSTKAVAQCCGKTPKEIREIYKTVGDLGLVIQKAKGT